MHTFTVPLLRMGVEDGEPIPGSELPVTIEYSTTHIRIIFGPPDSTAPDIFIERRGNEDFDVEIQQGDPKLIVEWRDGTIDVFDGNGFRKLATVVDGMPVSA